MRVPSAIVAGLRTVCSVFVRNDRVASSPSSGSMPITLQPGASAFVTMPVPESSPPPPHGTTTASSAGHFLVQLEGDGGLPGDHVAVIERRNQRGAVLLAADPAAIASRDSVAGS